MRSFLAVSALALGLPVYANQDTAPMAMVHQAVPCLSGGGDSSDEACWQEHCAEE